MQKNSRIAVIAAVVLATGAPASAQVLGPEASVCTAGSGPALLVKVQGLKDRAGKVRVRSFGGSPKSYFDKKQVLSRIEVATPKGGPVDVCVPVPAAGVYAIDVRHDANNNGDTDRADGAGASGNPSVSLMDVIFKRKPPAQQVQVRVSSGVTVVPVQVKYLAGGSFKPVQTARR